MIEGWPRSRLMGSSKKIKDNQTTGANQLDSTSSGRITVTAPNTISTYSIVFDRRKETFGPRLANAVAWKSAAVSKRAGKMVAKAQSYPTRRRKGFGVKL